MILLDADLSHFLPTNLYSAVCVCRPLKGKCDQQQRQAALLSSSTMPYGIEFFEGNFNRSLNYEKSPFILYIDTTAFRSVGALERLLVEAFSIELFRLNCIIESHN